MSAVTGRPVPRRFVTRTRLRHRRLRDSDTELDPTGADRRCSPSSADRTSASRRWSTACSAAGRRSCRTSRASPGTASPTTRCGTAAGSPSSTPAAGSPTPPACRRAVAAQAELAMHTADAVLLVVDASVGATETDEAVARVLRRSAVPVLLAATKVDDEPADLRHRRAVAPRAGGAAPGERPARARLSGDLLDAMLEALPESPARRLRRRRPAARAGWRWSASRTSASPACSTGSSAETGRSSTRSPARPSTRSTPWSSSDGEEWRFVDTAGLRRRVHDGQRHGVLRQPAHPGRDRGRRGGASCCSTPASRIAEQDQRVIAMVEEAGRALVLAFNKWDLGRRGPPLRAWRGSWNATWSACRGPSGSTSRRSTGRAVAKVAPALRTSAGVLGPAHLHRAAQRLAVRGHRRHPAAGARRQAAQGPVRHPGEHPPARRSCCSPAASWRRATGGSSSAGCGRSSASPARPSGSRCACGRSAAARAERPHRRRATLGAVGSIRPVWGSRDVAQLGSALDWGSRGRRFKSCRPDGEIGRCLE